MKITLLLIGLFLCIQGNCQQPQKDSLKFPQYVEYKAELSEEYKYAIRKWLSEEWQSYKQECWNDSTLTRVHDSKGEYCIVDWECIIESHWSNKWLHKQPSAEEFLNKLLR